MPYKNSFSLLKEDDEELVFTKNFKRKILKKIREINALKKKEKLNESELEKIGKENYWRGKLCPNLNRKKNKVNHDLKKKQYARHQKKQEKNRKRKLKEKRRIEKQKKEAREKEEREIKEKLERDKRKQEEEQENKKREEKRKKRNLQKKLREISQSNPMKKEFIEKILEGVSVDKIFRKMSLKYHPDKNANKKWAEEMQKKLIDIRDEINELH
jgi:hypothetical protein